LLELDTKTDVQEVPMQLTFTSTKTAAYNCTGEALRLIITGVKIMKNSSTKSQFDQWLPFNYQIQG
jgi:hypothetical protein